MTSALLPEPNADSRPYWDAARERRLVIRRCRACGAKHFMPRNGCPICWSEDLEWVDASGRGTVHTFSIVRRAPLPEFAANAPYVVAMVDLDEGPRMYANIVGEGALQVAIGDRVQVTFEDRGDGFLLPQFTRTSE
jgi:uncharacterized protein